jgi:hypothetical protein
MSKCKHDDVLLAELLTHITGEAIEIQIYKNKLNVVIYDIHHNDDGCHNQTEYEVELNYCPICGKKLK